MALQRVPGETNLRSGKVLEGSLHLGSYGFPVKIKIVRADSKSLGCAFAQEYPQIKTILEKKFALELKALQLKKADDRIGKDTVSGIAHWYTDDLNCDLYYIEKLGKVISYRIIYFDYLVEFNEPSSALLRIGNHILKPNDKSLEQLKSGLMRFVNNIEDLNHDHRIQINYSLHKLC